MTWTLKIGIVFLVQINIFDLQQPSVTFLKKKKNRKNKKKIKKKKDQLIHINKTHKTNSIYLLFEYITKYYKTFEHNI